MDAKQPEWRVDAGEQELAYRIVQRKPIRVEVLALPTGELAMAHQGSKRRPRPAIEIGDTRYYLVKSGVGWTSYLTEAGVTVARMRLSMTLSSKTKVSIESSSCPHWHRWILVCYVGFRVAASYRYMFEAGVSSGLPRLVGWASDYGLS